MNENQNIEWKASWRDDYLKWICGFANAHGGVLEIGRNDKGEVVGVADAAKLMEDLPNKMRDMLGIVPSVDLMTIDGKDLIRITMEPYPHPVSYKGQYYYRSGSTKQELKGAALDHFLLRKIGRHWDAVPVPGVALTDLDTGAISRFRQRAARSRRLATEMLAEDDAALIEKLRLTDGAYLKRAAVLLFHPDLEAFVTGAYIKVGYFKTDSHLLYHDEVHGGLFTQVDHTMDLLLTKYLKALISYEGLQRVETYPVPESALREALLNAVAHKDYASGVPIQISVYGDKILFWNNGRLPEDWTVERLLSKHPSQPFNPDIANAFFRAGMIEAWGRGIEQMQVDCEAHGVPGPALRHEANGLWVEFANRVTEKTSGEILETTQKTTQKTTQNIALKILAILRQNPSASRREIAMILEDITEDGVKYHLDKLKSEGRIRRIGPARGGHWQVRKDDGE
ncbi:MAG TPA: transcriptional regulator [Chloroflexi bacterium]|nr:transcriptional regulator [Chloroflexota bacterium]